MLQILKILTLSLLCSVSLANASWLGDLCDFLAPKAPPIAPPHVFAPEGPVLKECVPEKDIEEWEELALIRLHIEDPTLPTINIQDPAIQDKLTLYRKLSRLCRADRRIICPHHISVTRHARCAFGFTLEQSEFYRYYLMLHFEVDKIEHAKIS